MRRGLIAGIFVALAACEENTTAPTLSATCSANPASGPAPLSVSFNLAVAGATGTPQVSVDYGDGSTGTNPDVVHRYLGAGLFTAAFTVSAAGQSARCSTTVTVVSSSPVPTFPIVNTPPLAVFRTTPDAVPGDQ